MGYGRMDVVGIGFAIMDEVYLDGTLSFRCLGGSCGNVISSLAALGHAGGVVARVGDDEVGFEMARELTRAGCDAGLLYVVEGEGSPVLAHEVDTGTGAHSFSFRSPSSGEGYPKPMPVPEEAVRERMDRILGAEVLFVDRATPGSVEAMEVARRAGLIVYFEPDKTALRDKSLFDRAMEAASVAKFSAEWFPDMVANGSPVGDVVMVATDGPNGLDVRHAGTVLHCPAVPLGRLVDACGAGDAVTAGTVDWLLRNRGRGTGIGPLDGFVEGVVAGQRLASLNCAHHGSRGALRALGARAVRRVLEGKDA